LSLLHFSWICQITLLQCCDKVGHQEGTVVCKNAALAIPKVSLGKLEAELMMSMESGLVKQKMIFMK